MGDELGYTTLVKMRYLLILCALALVGCATPRTRSVAGTYSTPIRGIGTEILYTLSLQGGGTFEASYCLTLNGVPGRDSSLRAGGPSPQESLRGTWQLEGERLVLQSERKRYVAYVRRAANGWEIIWDDFVYNPNTEPAAQSQRHDESRHSTLSLI